MERRINLTKTRIVLYTDNVDEFIPPENYSSDFLEGYEFITPKDIFVNNVLLKNVDRIEVFQVENDVEVRWINGMSGCVNRSYILNSFVRIHESAEDKDVLVAEIDNIITPTYDEIKYPIIRNDVKLTKTMVHGSVYLKLNHIAKEIPILTIQSKSGTDMNQKLNEFASMLISNTALFSEQFDYILYDNAIFKPSGGFGLNRIICDDMTSQDEPICNMELPYEELLKSKIALFREQDIVYLNGKYYEDGVEVEKDVSKYLTTELYDLYNSNSLILKYLDIVTELSQYENIPDDRLHDYHNIYADIVNIFCSDFVGSNTTIYICHKRNIIAINKNVIDGFDNSLQDRLMMDDYDEE